MDDLLHDAEEGHLVASEGNFWNSQDDAKLWYHYRNGGINPYNNNREYLLQKISSTSVQSLTDPRLQSVACRTRTSIVSLN